MNSHETHQLASCAALMQLELEARRASNEMELSFLMVNRTQSVLPAVSIVFWRATTMNRGVVERVSSVSEVDVNTPFVQWITLVVKTLTDKGFQKNTIPITTQTLNTEHASEWPDSLPQQGLWSPLARPDGGFVGGLFLFSNQPWKPVDSLLIQRLTETYTHAWYALDRRSRHSFGASVNFKGWFFLGVVILILFMVPIRQSVLSPSTVVAQNPMLITSPMNGVIESILVEPNTVVSRGQIVFQLESSTIHNRWLVAKKSLKVAQAKQLKARQLSFSDLESKASLPLLQAQVEQRMEEVDYAFKQLQRVDVRSGREGIAIFGNASEWRGKPVLVGEKVMIIADPSLAELEIRMPIKDAIIMQIGSEVLLFLNTNPLQPIPSLLTHAGYEATPTPEGFLAYRLRARFLEGVSPPRIGLQGTAKVFGNQVSLFYHLFRRPLTALRQWIGL